jgi:ABC-type sugar transport system ATPase subunit
MPVLHRFSLAGWVRRNVERAAVVSALDRVSVTAAPAQPLTSLSGGNQQRALLARWFVAGVEVLLVDEPAVGVDVVARRRLLDELCSFARHGGAVLVSSSDIDDLVDVCDRIVCLKDGRASEISTPVTNWASAISDAIT